MVQGLEEALWRSYRRLVPARAPVLLAVSGGPDSMTLMSATARLAGRLGFRIEAATVDHQLRAESSDEAVRVGVQATSLGLRHHVLLAPVTATSKKSPSPRIQVLPMSKEYSQACRLLTFQAPKRVIPSVTLTPVSVKESTGLAKTLGTFTAG